MQELEIFKNEEFGEIRTLMIDGEPWFVAKDVCDILGISNPTMAIEGLENFERAKFNLGRQGEANIISESGFYTLVLRSRKPVAKPFRIWVTNKILPTIRKTGGYVNTDKGVPCFRRVLVIGSRETRHPLTGNFPHCEMVIAHKIAPHEMVCCFRIDSPFLDSEVHKNFIYLPLEKSAQKYYSKNIDTCSDDGFDNTDIR